MNWRKLRVKDIFNRTKIKVFLVGTYLTRIRPSLLKIEAAFLVWGGESTLGNQKLTETKGVDELNKAFNIVYRYLKCKPCMIKGSCVHCGCTTPDNIIPEKNYCSNYKWGVMEEDMLKFLDDMGLQLTLTNKLKNE